MESLRKIRERNLVEVAQATNVDDALLLQRISHRLHQLDEAACNWGLSLRQEKRVERLETQAAKIGAKWGFVAYHQGDPRGWSLHLTVAGEERPYTDGIAICPH